MIDNYSLTNLAKTAGIDRYTVLREYLQIIFLDKLYQNKSSKKIIFKGGTALRMLHGSPRFSEDLDFNTQLSGPKINQLVNHAIVTLQKNEAPGINVKTVKSLAGITKKIFFPTDITPMPLTIRLDFSKREASLTKLQTTITTNLPVFPGSLIQSLSLEEILAEKIRAILARNKGRDIFDLWFLLKKGVNFDKKLVLQKLKIYGSKFHPRSLPEKIKTINQSRLSQDIKKFLPLKNRSVVLHLKNLTLTALSQSNFSQIF